MLFGLQWKCAAATVDDKVVEVVKQQHEKAKQMLTKTAASLTRIAKYLYEKETITGEGSSCTS